MKLFLAEVTLTTRPYMGKTSTTQVTRLVKAAGLEQAKALVTKAFTREDPYGTNIDVKDVILYEALVEEPPPPEAK